MLSRRGKYGLKAVIYLARRASDGRAHIADISRDEAIPRKFLELILLDLKAAGVLRSKKGRGGGYALAREADAITFGEVIRALDGPLAPTSCVSVNFYKPCEECSDEARCAIRVVMKQARDAIADVLDNITIGQSLHAPGEPARGRR